ncbi:MAG: hypothetical protein ACRD2B_15955, partial [Terriglobia bacterium]
YMVEVERHAVLSADRLAPADGRQSFRKMLLPFADQLTAFGQEQAERLRLAATERAKMLGASSPVQPVVTPPPEQAVASTIVVKRLRFGTIPLDQIAPNQREGYPSGAWDLVPITALYWCNGRRNLAEVAHLTKMELGPTNFNFVGYFRFLRDHGFVQFVKGQ